jgi:hypothetical protein
MGGGLLQLVAYGAQDVYLSGNPQITFFKVAYRRHTNFSMESIEQTFNGVANFGRRVTCQISRNGDLIHRMYLQVGLENASWEEKAYAGLALVKSVELEIGGQRIDKQYGDWMYIWNELTLDGNKREGFDDMVGGSGGIGKAVAAPVAQTVPNDEVGAVDADIDELVVTTSNVVTGPVTAGTVYDLISGADFTNITQTTASPVATPRINAILVAVNAITVVINSQINETPYSKFSGATNATALIDKLAGIQTGLGTVKDTIINKINSVTAFYTGSALTPDGNTITTNVVAAFKAVDLALEKAASETAGVLYMRRLKSLASDYKAAAFNAYNADKVKKTLYIPLEFWFCRNPGLALPLIALQYHEVKVNLELNTASEVGIKYPTYVVSPHPADTTGTGESVVTVTENLAQQPEDIEPPKMTVAALWVDYVFLDTDERRRFAQLSHEYLIEQLQFTGEENVSGSSNKVKLNFNHPVKELVWVMQQSASPFGCYDDSGSKDESGAAASNGYVRTGMNLTESANIQLNGHDRFAVREGKYFNRVQPFQHHTNVPTNKGINVYSFALKPEEHQPSGTLNFSRIDSAILSVKAMSKSAAYLNPSKIRVYAVNYNVLRVMSGMGGLAYSN